VQKPGLGGFAGEPSSLTLTGAYCDELDRLAHWPHNPATQHINTVTTHWNQVTKRGAGMEIPSFDIRILFRYTIAMLTNQYVPTTLATAMDRIRRSQRRHKRHYIPIGSIDPPINQSSNSENSLYIASGVAIVENRFVGLNYMMEFEMEFEGKCAAYCCSLRKSR